MDVRMPAVGEVLVHRSRRREGEARAEVINVDPERRSVLVRMDGREYASLSAAAKTAASTSQKRLDLLGPQEAGGAGTERVRSG